MSIEDVNYLYKNSVKDNSIIFIESKKRNKKMYPTPSEYVITFENPFKYVYGMEILDASIPRTMYQIDKTNNNLKIVLGDANYHIYKNDIYNPELGNSETHISSALSINTQFPTNANWQGNYGNTDMNYIDSNGTTENSGFYGNGSLIWLRDITLDSEDVNIDSFISKLNNKFSELPNSIGNSHVSIANNKKITFRAVSNPSTNVSKILIYSGSDADNNGLIEDTIPFYILAYDSNISETLGFDEDTIANSSDYNSTLTDLEKRNIFMLLNNITINDWNTISEEKLVRPPSTNSYSKLQWEGSKILDETHPYDITRSTLNDRDRTLLVLQKYDENNSTKHYEKFLLFEINIKNRIFKSGRDKGDIGKYNLGKNSSNIYNTSFPDFKVPNTIEYKVTWDDINFRYKLENKISGIGDYSSITNNPSLTFILGNNYKFDLSDGSNNKKFCFIKYTGIGGASDNQIIRLFSGNQEKIFTAKDTLSNPAVNTEFQIDAGDDDDTTAQNLVNTINAEFSVDFKAGINTNLDFIFISYLGLTLPDENDSNFTNISNIQISNFDFIPEFNFSFYSDSDRDNDNTNTNFEKNIIEKNVTRVGTPGTDGAYVQYNTTDTDYGNSPNTLFGTPNSFYYLSSPSINDTINNIQNPFSHTSSGNTITLQRSSVNRIQTPGMINLTGERLITLKSKNIEEHLYKNESGTSSIGIALFKLGISSSYSENRLDFNNYKPKDFHPIGKLSFIDFRFEIDNNILYDFKGVNHNLLINIKYFVPHKNIDNINYSLNANYNPNFINYEKTQYEKDNQSDEELEQLTNNFGKNFLEKEKEFLYSSDEDLEYVEPNNNNYSDSDTSESSSDDEYHPANKNNMTPYHFMYKS